jgi:3-oxoadipate enol-lactonase
MKTVTARDIAYAYREEGQGPPVLLVHGFPVDHSMWRGQIESLAADHRVIALDLRGFGATPLAATEAEADQRAACGVAMEEYADDLAAVLDALGISEPITLAGFSMGGYVAWQFWKKHRQRIKALVLCDTRAAADTDEARRGRLDMAEHVAEWGSAKVAEMMQPKLFAAETIDHRSDVVQAVRQVISGTDPRAIAAAQRGMAARPDVTGWLSQIDVPSLFIVGEHDAISRSDEMRSMAEAVPGGELVVVPRAGHMAPVENPQAVTAALGDFLRRTAAQSG